MSQDEKMPAPSRREKTAAALGRIIGWADRETNRSRATLAFASAQPYTQFQQSEWNGLFLCDAYGQLIGAKCATTAEIVSAFCNAEAAAFVGEHCASPYWFWTLLGNAACDAMTRVNIGKIVEAHGIEEYSDVLPFTRANLVAAQERIRQRQGEIFGNLAGGISRDGYSGTYLPEHLEADFQSNPEWLKNVSVHRQAGLSTGHLLMEPYTQMLPMRRKLLSHRMLFSRRRVREPMLMSTILNPLLRTPKKS